MSESGKAVFLSYSSEDATAAGHIRDALCARGLEVWFDKSELRGGDAWDASIRKQIKECSLFVPIVSASTEARREGYFRLEWKLAVDRSHLMSDDQPFLLPVTIDGTSEATARVPDRFREFQWFRGEGDPTFEAFADRAHRLLSGEVAPSSPSVTAVRTPVREHSRTPQASEPRRSRNWTIPAVAAILMVAAIVLSGTYKKTFPRQPTGSGNAAATDTRMTFAILPLSYPEGDKQAATFAASLAEALVTRQTISPWSRAVSRESAERAMKNHSSLREVGRQLGVRYLVRGHVTRNGEIFATNLSIVDADSEQVLGTEELAWPVARPVNVFRQELDSAMGTLAGRGFLREVAAVKLKKAEDLNARDLTYLANLASHNTKEGYDEVMALLNKALKLAPDDPLALMLVARVNLCECRSEWSKTPEVQERIGAEALEKYLAKNPNDRRAQIWKVYLHEMHGRYEDAIVILDRFLEKSPGDPELLANKAYNFLKMDQNKEALTLIQAAMLEDSSWRNRALASAAHFKLANYRDSADMAQKAIAEMDKKERADRWTGSVLLVRAAAATDQGRMPQAKAAVAEFHAAVPAARTISQIRAWMDPRAEIAGYEPLYAALRKAGVPD